MTSSGCWYGRSERPGRPAINRAPWNRRKASPAACVSAFVRVLWVGLFEGPHAARARPRAEARHPDRPCGRRPGRCPAPAPPHARTSARSARSTSGSFGLAAAGATALLRILMTNACSYNCDYCPMRRDREMPRTLLKPEELVRIFLGALRRGWVDGLFVTTGIPSNPVKVMDELIAALELLRERHGFAGYIHVKLVAGAEPAQIERLTALASRVSLNLEAPCGQSLTRIAPGEEPAGGAGEPRARACHRARGAHGAGARPPGGRAPPRRRRGHDDAVRGRRHARHRPHAARDGGAAPGGRRHPPHALQRLPADHRHADGERGRRAGAAGAPAVSGRLSAPRLRLHRGRGGLRAVRKPAALGGPQGGLGAGASGAVSGGDHACRLTRSSSGCPASDPVRRAGW